MKQLTIRLFVVGCALGISLSAIADGMIVVRPTPLQRRQGLRNFPLEVKYHRVKTVINNGVALTAIDQVFHNPTRFRLEGTYVFPVPRGAVFSRFSMDIDGVPVKGEILDRDKARQIYEEIVRKSQDPALLEYIGTQLIRLRIFPIEPKSDKRIKIKYSELLKAEQGLISYRYPLNTEKFSSKPLEEVSIEVSITDDAEVKSIYSPTHPVTISRKDKTSVVVRYEARKLKPNRDFLLTYLRSKKAVGLSALTYKRGDLGHFAFVISPKIAFDKEDILPKDVVFVLDTSGSMLEQDKIGQARKALAYCLGRLSEKDRFNVIDFSTDVRSFARRLTPVNKDSRAKALAYIDDLDAAGGTNIDEALRMAAGLTREATEGRPFTVVFITDGKPTIGERKISNILKNVKLASKRFFRLFSIGVGNKVNTHLLDHLSSVRRGTSLYVGPGENLEVKISAFFDKFAYPVLTDLKLTVNGVRIRDMYPRPLPDLFKGSQLVLFGTYKGAGSEAITLEGTYRGKKRQFVYETTFAAGKTAHDYLPHLWAKRKVGYLMDQIRLHGRNPEIRKEIIRLAKRYGIMTPYTSFLVLEDERRLRAINPRAPMKGAPGAGRFFGGARGNRLAQGADKAMKEQSGSNAVEASKRAKDLKQKNHLSDDEGEGSVEGGGGRPAIRRIADKIFYRTGELWVDSAYDASKMKGKLIQVVYFSKAYFELLKKHEDIGRFLALGKQLIVVTGDGSVIQVTPK